jgi:hypothetical protein
LPLGGDGVRPDLIMFGGGEREEYVGPDVSTTGLTGIGLPRYPTGGVGVGAGIETATGLDEELEVLRPLWRACCLWFWNLKEGDHSSEFMNTE